jgi:hypothetical protein
VTETLHRAKRRHGAPPEVGDDSLVAFGRGVPQLKCGLCGEILPMRSNQALHEGLARLGSHLLPLAEPAGSHSECVLFGGPLSKAAGQCVQLGVTL